MGLPAVWGIEGLPDKHEKVRGFSPGCFPVEKTSIWAQSPRMQEDRETEGSQRTCPPQEACTAAVTVTVGTCFPSSLREAACSSQGSEGVGSGKESREESPFRGLRVQVPLPSYSSQKCLCPCFCPSPSPPNIPAWGRGRPADTKPSVYGVACVPPPSTQRTQCPFCSLPPSLLLRDK